MNNTFKKRVDELGRIVIPKQIRNTFKIRDFDELELYIEDDNIILKKTGGIFLLKEKFDNVLNFICKYLLINTFILEQNKVVSTNISDIKDNSILLTDINDFLINQDQKELLFDNDIRVNGYIKTYQLIRDSNLYGYIVFVSDKLKDDIDIYKDITNILLDIIK